MAQQTEREHTMTIHDICIGDVFTVYNREASISATVTITAIEKLSSNQYKIVANWPYWHSGMIVYKDQHIF